MYNKYIDVGILKEVYKYIYVVKKKKILQHKLI